MEIQFRAYKNSGAVAVEIKCCGQQMKVRHGIGKSWNDSPHTYRCDKCHRWFKGNSHFYTAPPPMHMTVILKEVRQHTKDNEGA